MKEFMKRAAALLAAAMMVMAVSTSAFAEPDATARPRSSASSSQSQSTSSKSSSSEDEEESSSSSKSSSTSKDEDEDSSSKSSTSEDEEKSTSTKSTSTKAEEKPAETQPPVVTAAPAAAAPNKSYTTKGGAFLWFLLSIIVNTVISFAIAKRFYRLAKQSNHVQAEIRALRRDIEEKFADSIGGFAEPAIDISNTNDDYSSSEDGIKVNPVSAVDESGAEVEDVYKEWEAQFASRHANRPSAKAQSAPEENYADDDIDELEEKRTRKKYLPQRPASSNRQKKMTVREKLAARRAEEENDEDLDIPGISPNESSGIGAKAKQLLNGIFPMGDDDE